MTAADRPRWRRREMGRLEYEGAISALAVFSDLMVQLDEQQLGKVELFSLLTGSRSLWWRSCQEAVHFRPGWLHQENAGRALQVIEFGELPQSSGAVLRAAQAAKWISQALTWNERANGSDQGKQTDQAGIGDRPRELVARAASCWSRSRAMPMPQEEILFPSEATLAAVSPELRDRVRALLGWLESPAREPGQAMAAISAVMLAGASPHPHRVVRVPIVLADQRTAEVTGVAGTLELREFPAGPPGLFPDPSAMRILRTDTKFDQALRHAWTFAVDRHCSDTCVLWRISLEANAPDFAIDGGSLGGAFAIALRELLLKRRGSGWSALTMPRRLFLSLRSGCAITGVVTPQRPDSYARSAARATRTAQAVGRELLWLDAVGDMDAKLQAAKNKGWRLIAPAANHERDTAQVPETVHVDWVQTIRQADKYARRIRPLRTFLAVLSVLALTGVSTATAVALGKNNEAHNQAEVAQSRTLAAEATADLPSNPRKSLGLALKAVKINPGGPAEQALRLALAQDHLRMVIRSGEGSATVAAWDPTRAQLALNAPHDSVALWDTATGRLLQVLHGPPAGRVTELLYDPAGTRLAAVSVTGYVSMWNISRTGSASPVSTTHLNAIIRANMQRGFINSSPYYTLSGFWSRAVGDQFLVYGMSLRNVISFAPGSGHAGLLFHRPLSFAGDGIASNPQGARLLINGSYITSLATGHKTMLYPRDAFLAIGAPPCWLPDGSAVMVPTTAQVGGFNSVYRANGSLLVKMPMSDGATTATACSASPTDNWAAAGDEGGNVYLSLAGGKIDHLYGHNSDISAIASSRDGHYLATASYDGSARVWDARTGQVITILTGDGAPLIGVQFGPSDGLVLTVDKLGLVRIWDTGVGKSAPVLQSPLRGRAVPLGFTQDGQQVAGADVVTSSGPEARVTSVYALAWNARTGELVRRVPLPGFANSSIPCGPGLQDAGGMDVLSVLPDSVCHVPPPPNLVLTVPVNNADIELLAVAASPDGRYIAYARARSVSLLDSDGRQVARLPLPDTPTGLSFGPGSADLLVMTNKAIYLWRPFSGHRPLAISQPSPPVDAALSTSGNRLVAADGGVRVSVWNTANGSLVGTFRPPGLHPSPSWDPAPLRVAISGNGSIIASGNSDGTVCLWNVATGKRIRVDTLAYSEAIVELSSSKNGSRLLAVTWPGAASGPQPPEIGEVLNTETGHVIARYQSPSPAWPAAIPGAALSASGNFLFSGALGLAPGPPGGIEAAYEISTSQAMVELQAADEHPTTAYPLVPAQPWSPNGAEVLAGTAIYPCDACESSGQLRATATARIAWSQPLSQESDHPPLTNPYS